MSQTEYINKKLFFVLVITNLQYVLIFPLPRSFVYTDECANFQGNAPILLFLQFHHISQLDVTYIDFSSLAM